MAIHTKAGHSVARRVVWWKGRPNAAWNDAMRCYEFLSRLLPGSSYLVKMLLVSFVGVHIPMIGAVVYVLIISDMDVLQQVGILVALLLATLVGTVATMGVHYALLQPISRAADALREYLIDRSLPTLPIGYRDEAGVLLANVQEAVTRLDTALTASQLEHDTMVANYREKFGIIAGMSHDFRTPLNHVIGFAELMSAQALGPIGTTSYLSYAENIGSSGSELLETLQAVLDFSAVEAKADNIDLRRTRLWEPFQRAAKLSHTRVGGSGGRIVVPVVECSTMVLSNPRILAQVAAHAFAVAAPPAPVPSEVRLERIAKDTIVLESDQAWSDTELQMVNGVTPAAGSVAASQNSSIDTLRIALLDTLVRAGNGVLRLSVNALGGRRMELTFPMT